MIYTFAYFLLKPNFICLHKFVPVAGLA